MTILPEKARDLLAELGEWLEWEQCESVDWIICGGTALALLGLTNRPTKDVDVLGHWDEDNARIVKPYEIPDGVQKCIRKVAERNGDLTAKWINTGPGRLCVFGLPDDLHHRLKTETFGAKLTVRILGREDLIALKLYAASDDRGPRKEIHEADLKLLDPTESELERAITWAKTMPDINDKILCMKDVVQELGYDGLAYYI